MGIVLSAGQWKKTLRHGVGFILISASLAACTSAPSTQWPWVFKPPVTQPRQTFPGSPATPPITAYPPGLHGDYAGYPALHEFINHMVGQYGFDRAFLEQTFSGVRRDRAALAKVASPAEGKPWQAYRAIFMTEERVQGGVAFWNQNAAVLDSAARQYGVDPAYLVAIIGVETKYGGKTGDHNALQALTTLGFDYPARGEFYRSELEQFLLLAREERVKPDIFNSSYAGAMGLGQFIPSSYRSYAVDYNHDGKRDLWNPADAVGSVANYFAQHGWQRGGDVAVPAYVSGNGYARLAETAAARPSHSLGKLADNGVRPQGAIHSAKVGLVKLEGAGADEYWIGAENFYVITRYNHSPKYAMVVHQLAQAIRQRKFGY